jgi:hypothetical protein
MPRSKRESQEEATNPANHKTLTIAWILVHIEESQNRKPDGKAREQEASGKGINRECREYRRP